MIHVSNKNHYFMELNAPCDKSGNNVSLIYYILSFAVRHTRLRFPGDGGTMQMIYASRELWGGMRISEDIRNGRATPEHKITVRHQRQGKPRHYTPAPLAFNTLADATYINYMAKW